MDEGPRAQGRGVGTINRARHGTLANGGGPLAFAWWSLAGGLVFAEVELLQAGFAAERILQELFAALGAEIVVDLVGPSSEEGVSSSSS